MMHSPLSRTPRSTRSEPPKTLPASPLLQPPQPCQAEILGEGQTAATIPTPGGAQESPGSPACSPAPSPRHRQETTAAACGQLITVTQPHPACTPPPGSCPHACCSPGPEVHPHRAQRQPQGSVSPRTELGALTNSAVHAPGHTNSCCAWAPCSQVSQHAPGTPRRPMSCVF